MFCEPKLDIHLIPFVLHSSEYLLYGELQFIDSGSGVKFSETTLRTDVPWTFTLLFIPCILLSYLSKNFQEHVPYI